VLTGHTHRRRFGWGFTGAAGRARHHESLGSSGHWHASTALGCAVCSDLVSEHQRPDELDADQAKPSATIKGAAGARTANTKWRQVPEQLRPKVPKLAELMDAAEHDILPYMDFPREQPLSIRRRAVQPSRAGGIPVPWRQPQIGSTPARVPPSGCLSPSPSRSFTASAAWPAALAAASPLVLKASPTAATAPEALPWPRCSLTLA